MVYCLYQRLDWIFQQQKKKETLFFCQLCMYVWKKKYQTGFFNSSYNLFFNFYFSGTPLRQPLLSDYTLMLSSQTEWYYFYQKHISFTNGIFDMQTSLVILFTILRTMNHAYLIFNTAIT